MPDAAIVLCGGRSRRMGRDKWSLPFGDETLLARVVRRIEGVVEEVVVVAREGQDVGGGFTVACDPAEGRGPLAGLVAGLEAVQCERAFLTACDVPFLDAALVRWMLDEAGDHPLAVPFVDGHFMMTAAVYSKAVLNPALRLLADNRLRPFFLVDALDTRVFSEDEIRARDPELQSFRNCNTPAEYAAALKDAGCA